MQLPPHFPVETIHKTIVKLPCSPHDDESVVNEPTALAAIDQLLTVVASLYQTAQQNGVETGAEGSNLAWTIDTLMPYVSEEVDDVLDALQEIEGSDQKATPGEAEMVAIGTLVPRLLWSVMRSSYPVMRLLEGVEVQQYQAGQDWQSGILRLVVLLDLQLPDLHYCFDLTTQQPPTNLLTPDSLLQGTDSVLPLPRSPIAFVVGIAGPTAVSAEQNLQALQHQVQWADPRLQQLLEGISVDCLHPGRDWQVGQLQLKLGFEFLPQPFPEIDRFSQVATDLIEAELLEDMPLSMAALGKPRTMAAATHVAVIELPPQSLTTAQIRFPRSADLSDQDRFPHWREAIVRANQSLTTTDRDHQRATMVRAACVTATARQQAMNWNNRPLCLVDELVPWLLWQISRCSYPLMQLVGGIAAQVLQPGNHWQQGVLRLLPTLHLQTPTIEHRFDLATGQSLRLGQGVLPGDAICQQSAEIGWLLQTQPIAWLQSPVQVQWLLQQVQQTALTLPEMACLQAGIAVDWSEASPNWQAATLSLTLDFTFLSETTYDGDDRPW